MNHRILPLFCLALAAALPLRAQTGPGPMQMGASTKPASKVAVTRPAPVSLAENIVAKLAVKLPAPDAATIRKANLEAADPAKGPRRIGITRWLPAPLESSTEAGWHDLRTGGKLWVATVESADAVALRLLFEDVALPEGAWIQVYAALNPQDCRGPFDAAHLGRRAQFWSEAVFDQKVVVECYCPPSADVSAVRFRLQRLAHRDVKGAELEHPLAKAAGACNLDVTCYSTWLETSKAVARYTFLKNGNEYLCTGCLLNDAEGATYLDYFLTANHCLENQVEADTAEFYWFYQTSTCNGAAPDPASVPRTSGGADFLAGATRSQGNDFTFLHLITPTPGGVTYSGWSTFAPGGGETMTSIHHPAGDFKRISFGAQQTPTTEFWRVTWNNGTTEGGSSGGPLFNASQQVIGQLYGGEASCSNPSGVDEYGRLDSSFLLIRNWLLSQPVIVTNDSFASARPISGNTGTNTASSAGATKESGEPNHGGNLGGYSIWFRWTASAATPVSFKTLGSGFDTVMGVYTGAVVSALTIIASNDDYLTNRTSQVTFTPQAGATYSIAVDGYNGAGGSVVLSWTTNAAAVNVPNDHFASATVLTGTAGLVAGSSVGATKQAGEPNHAGNTGGASVWYRWTAPSNTSVTWNTFSSDFDTLLAVYTGGSVSALTTITNNDDYFYQGAGGGISEVTFNATGGTTYYIAVDGYNAAAGTVVLGWLTPPTNDTFASAQNISGLRGDVSALTTAATKQTGEPNHAFNAGGKSVWFRWVSPTNGTVYFDTEGSSVDTLLGVYRGGAVNSLTLVATNDDLSASVYQSRVSFAATLGTTYYIAVDGYRDPAGGVSQGFALLTWYPGSPSQPAPAHDNFAAAQLLTGAGGSVTGTTVRATKEASEPSHAGNAGGKSVWYRWTAPATGLATFDTAGTDFDTLLAAYQGVAVGSLTQQAASDDASGTARTSRVSFLVTGGQEYRLAVDGLQTESGTVREGTVKLAWVFTPDIGGNDMFAQAQLLPGGTGSTFGANLGATLESGEPAHAGALGGSSVWYRWTPLANAPVRIDTLGSTFDTLLAVYTGNAPDSLSLVAANDEADVFTSQSVVNFTAQAGKEYHIAVDGYDAGSGAAQGSILLHWSQPLGTQPVLEIARTQGVSGLHFTLSGVSGPVYRVEYGSNLLGSWNLLTNIPSTGGVMRFFDPTSPSQARRFYRTVVQ